MNRAKLGIMAFVLPAVMIGCGGGDGEKEKQDDKGAEQQSRVKQDAPKGSDPQSRMKRYAPKDAMTAVYLDVAAARKGLGDALKQYAKEAEQIKLDVVTSVLEKIDSIIVYMMHGEGPPLPVIVIHGDARPGDLTRILANLGGGAETPDPKLEPKANGRYKLAGAPLPILVIDGGEADDLDKNVMVVAMEKILTPAFVGAMGKHECPAVKLALDKADTSAMLWGAMLFDKLNEPGLPETGVFSANLTGDKLLGIELTFKNLEIATKAEKDRQGTMQMFGDAMALKRSGATLAIESTRGGNLASLLIPAVRGAVERANQAACRANLKGIAIGYIMYRGEHKNSRFPESLKVLVDNGLITPDAFQCPGDKSQRACSYLYLAPARGAHERTLTLCDLKDNHEEIRNVGFADGVVTSMSEAEFQAALKLPRNAKFAAALKKAGG